MLAKALPAGFLIGVIALFAPLAAAKADEGRGMILGLSCAACHGTAGKSPGSIPTINGKSADYIKKALEQFRDENRPATVMSRLAKGYTDDEIAALANYFASLK